MEDIFGLLTSGTQAGYEDSSFFWSDAFHYRKTYHFARTLYKNALNADAMKTDANEPSRVPKQQAFALGWISHCATDVAGHPFTNAKVRRPVPDALAAPSRRREPHGRPRLPRQARHRSDGVVLLARHVGAPFPAGVPARRGPGQARGCADRRSTGSLASALPAVPAGRRPRLTRRPGTTRSTSTAGRCPSTSASSCIDTMKDVYGGPGDMSGPQVAVVGRTRMAGRPSSSSRTCTTSPTGT